MTSIIEQLRRADPPAHVMALVVFAVVVVPGGIPMTLAALPVYLKRRAAQRAT